MKDFSALITELDQTTKTSLKTNLLRAYFSKAPDTDKLWCIALFSGRRPKRAVSARILREWAAEEAGLALWLVDEAYAIVGDLAETLALILPNAQKRSDRSLADWCAVVTELKDYGLASKKARVSAAWSALAGQERFVFNKLLTGGFRIGVSQKLMTKALALATQKEPAEIAHRLMGNWDPTMIEWDELIHAPLSGADVARPYPFCLAHALDVEPQSLGVPEEWAAEWKWDGIRGQVLVRGGRLGLWSRGEELMTDRFPEFAPFVTEIPNGTVLDGEILAWGDGIPRPFSALQPRIGRKTVSKSLQASNPARFLAYDLLEDQGRDMREDPYSARRARLEQLLALLPASLPIGISPRIAFENWQALETERSNARDHHAEGLMLKRIASPYSIGRKRGAWWKWKLEPFSIDAVMIYAQSGHGRRANLFTDFTFALWQGDTLVPVTKAYSGLSDAEFSEITRWVRKNTLARFGPVRQVTPHHVFEIAFDGLQASKRHKSGVALRFPRMKRWRHDKPAAEATQLSELMELLTIYG